MGVKRWRLCLLAPLLAGCTVVSTPRDAAQWTTTVHGVTVTWRWVAPGTLQRRGDTPYAGYTLTLPLAQGCVVDIDPALSRHDLVRVAAHEYGHCAAGRYLQLGVADPQGLSAYHRQLWEQWPERYAQAYLAACGPSLRPLGWYDLVQATCAEAPDPRTVSGERTEPES
ncbi:hypothetical protein L1280_003056 [Deinococcus sp. HSC-46F16]|uniref:hypothetical protein n=1 Tax=Deinococcus sp. HSC-46F16 TaxID=2910968 RepID=UPI0020A0EBED|nr:hypothetical protein [Deinococcus sp. HSC-46F16]MCP2015876.1 hypothetical protein [Deinococcus sp. HSC-46F16]